MKISSLVLTVLLIVIVLISWNLIIEDFETNYIETGVSNVSEINDTYKSTFVDTGEINESLQPLIESLEEISEEDKGFVEGLLDLGMVLPIALISFIGVTFNILRSTLTSSTTFLNLIEIPTEIIGIAIISFVAFVLFKLVSFLNKREV